MRSARVKRDDRLNPEIKRVWQANMQVYGADKVWRQLNREGHPVARCTVERLMKRQGLQGVRRGKIVRTTIANAAVPCPLDRVNRQFKADRPNQLWVSDFSAPCRRGWRNPDRSGWFPTGSWNAALLGRDTGQKGAAKFCRVLTAGCHKQSSLNCT